MSHSHGSTILDRSVATALQCIGTVVAWLAVGPTRSVALLAELSHFFSDALPGLIGLIVAIVLWRRGDHHRKHWGYDLSTVVNAGSMVVGGVLTLVEAIKALILSHRTINFHVAIIVAVICLGCNGFGTLRAMRHRHSHTDLREYAKHLAADTLLSGFILLSLVLAAFNRQTLLDALGAIVVGVWMAGYGLTSRSAKFAARRLQIRFQIRYR